MATIASGELDRRLDEAETLSVDHPAGPTEVRLYVTVDIETLDQLEERAARTGTRVSCGASRAADRSPRRLTA